MQGRRADDRSLQVMMCPAGSMYCFRVADAYLKGFLPIRSAVVTGNHDLEGDEFETDEQNLAAWTKVSSLSCAVHQYF